MSRPKAGYRTEDGCRVPGVTTIIGKFKEAGGLIHWAWQLGIDGQDYREVRDKAAGIGNIAHDMVECHIRGREFDPSPYDKADVDKAENSFLAFLEWAGQTNLKAIETETSLISEKHRFGGTLDAMLVSGKLALGDWKTSNSVYPEYLLQLAAYKLLWEENRPKQPITGGFHLLRFDKTHGDFGHFYYGNLDEAAEAFLLERRLYDLMAGLKKRTK